MASFVSSVFIAASFFWTAQASQCLSDEKLNRELRLTKMEAALQGLKGKLNDQKVKMDNLNVNGEMI